MIIISLDESGHFENVDRPQCMLIGGLVFQCPSEQELRQEKNRLRKFFETICSEQQGKYPADLHPTRNEREQIINKEALNRVKTALEQEMPDYLQMKGRWEQGRPQNSHYSIFCMVGDSCGLDDQNAGNLRDNFASIRYDHMVYRTIENLIFFNPLFLSEKKIHLDLPTRVYPANDPNLINEYKTMGIPFRKIGESNQLDRSIYELTNANSFRTCLESALLNSDRKDLTFNLKVQSINYSNPNSQQMFLYLSDTICSVWENVIHGSSSIEEAFPKLEKRGEELTDPQNVLLWAYHRTDQEWRSCWMNYRNGKWFDALQTAYSIHSSQSPICSVYKKTWIRPLEKELTDTSNYNALREAISLLDQYTLDKTKREQGTALYIMDQLRKNLENVSNESERGSLEYRISKIMMGLYNHQGDFENAKKEYEKCIKSAKYVPIEEHLGLQLPYIVSLCDRQQFEEAEEISRKLISYHELLNEIKKDAYPDSNTVYDSYARSLSQHGQCIAYLGKYSQAIGRFRQALSIFEKNSNDWYMTESYLLHALIEGGDRKTYETEAKEYFHYCSAKKQFNAIMEEKCGNKAYALYVFLKGLWVYGGTETDPPIMQAIIESCLKQAVHKSFHPWEQILKYCAFIHYRYFENEKDHNHSEEIMTASESILKDTDGILKIILEENKTQYLNIINGRPYADGSKLTFNYR